jgi:hypothetical protein
VRPDVRPESDLASWRTSLWEELKESDTNVSGPISRGQQKRKPAHALIPVAGVSDPLQKARKRGLPVESLFCEGGLEGGRGG